MYRKLASVLVITGIMGVEQVSALGLGDMTMRSALNQPLDAEIRLTNVGDLDQSQIMVKLANPDEFSSAGMEYTSFLSQIKFSVELDKDGQGVVKIRTKDRLNEPFLDLLIETVWPTGRVLRSYTVLVDLPVYTEPESTPVTPVESQKSVVSAPAPVEPSPQPVQEAAAPVVAPSASEPQSESGKEAPAPVASDSTPPPPSAVREPAPAPSPVLAPVKTAKPVAEPAAEKAPVKAASPAQPPKEKTRVAEVAYSSDTYRIEKNDTLWEIAEKIAPSSELSVHQTMLAIQQLNPHAFIGNNINRIKSGEVLRVPQDEAIRSISFRDAVRMVADQNRDWRPAPLDATAAGSEPVTPIASEGEARLTLTSAGTGAANGKTKKGKDSGALQQQLDQAQESVEVLSRDKKDQSKKIDSLNSQVDKLNKMIELKNAELASVQQELARKEAAAKAEGKKVPGKGEATKPAVSKVETPATKELVPAEPVAAPVPAEPVAEVSKLETPAVEETKPEVAEARKEKPKKPKQAPKKAETPLPPSPEPSFLQKIQDKPIFFIGPIAVLISFVFAFILWRRKVQQDKVALEAANLDLMDGSDHSFDERAAPAEESNEDWSTADTDSSGDHGMLEEEAVSFDVEEAAPTAPETGDAISEADIYIAYGKYQQAADLLTGAIAASPHNVSLRTKLLEVYVESRNKDGFQKQFLELQDMGETEAVRHAKELLSTSESVSDWLDDIAPASSRGTESDFAASDADMEMDLDLDSDFDLGMDSEPEVAATKEEVSPDLADDDFGGMDFDLDLDTGAAEEEVVLKPEEEVAADSSSDDLDFSLDLDAEDGAVEATASADEDSSSSLDDLSLDFSEMEEPELDVAVEEPEQVAFHPPVKKISLLGWMRISLSTSPVSMRPVRMMPRKAVKPR
jgi:pilus assembly protein FimV